MSAGPREASWWHVLADGRMQCDLCPRDCRLHEGQRGLCYVRQRIGDRMVPTSPPLCPTVNDVKTSYTGLWSRPAVGVGGSSVMVNEATQGYLHYIYDGAGQPVWLLGANVNDGLPQAEIPLLQFSGYCAVCSGDAPTSQEVGLLTLEYSDDATASWNLDYVLAAPLGGSVDRSDDVIKLTTPLVCQ